MEVENLVMGIIVGGLAVIVTSLLTQLLLCAFFDIDLEDIWNYITRHIKKLDTRVVIGSKWASGRYEVIEIKREYPETNSEIAKKYQIEKDKVIMIYLRDTRTREIHKYEISDFKRWFRK